jgi:hypothetical protein
MQAAGVGSSSISKDEEGEVGQQTDDISQQMNSI